MGSDSYNHLPLKTKNTYCLLGAILNDSYQIIVEKIGCSKATTFCFSLYPFNQAIIDLLNTVTSQTRIQTVLSESTFLKKLT